ncbi:SCO family protein [Methylobacter sp.]|uniref:SCO family protein n=1 Tax=Methylobacter sp. TaxID=2051955 RepID=UPI0012106D94|nr:SCO family protein [Methylobacter sp.]TAK59658.1 MAG: c-type cytochrome [Methylobacter sp.]
MMKTSCFSKLFLCNVFIGVILTLGSGPAWAAPPGSPWGADYFPNIPLVTQDGKTVRFYDDLIKDKVIAINFIYTHCGDTCPLETASLRQVQKLLGDRVGKDVFFYSISIDPKHDTPKALKEYAAKFNVGPGWTFLTGTKADTTLLRKKLGLYREEAEAKKLGEHNVSFMIGNEATGQWMKRSPFDEPKVLAWLLGRKLHNFKVATSEQQVSYAAAKQLPKISLGEDLFRSRCDSCHSLGTEDGLGPGLQGVAKRRERAWLTRWLKMPDRMLTEKDPIATDLFNRYKKLPMPNLRLTDADVEALIKYMESPMH